MNLQQSIEWYEEGERDQDFLVHLAGLAIPRMAELERDIENLTEQRDLAKAESHKLYATWYTTVQQRAEQAEAEVKVWRRLVANMDRLRLEQVERAEEAEAELAKYKWMTRQGLLYEYGAQQLDAEYEAQIMAILEREWSAQAEAS